MPLIHRGKGNLLKIVKQKAQSKWFLHQNLCLPKRDGQRSQSPSLVCAGRELEGQGWSSSCPCPVAGIGCSAGMSLSSSGLRHPRCCQPGGRAVWVEQKGLGPCFRDEDVGSKDVPIV